MSLQSGEFLPQAGSESCPDIDLDKPGSHFVRRAIGLVHGCSQNGTRQYFGVGPLTIRVDVGPGVEHASCYGVNLACPVFWGVSFFPPGGAFRPAGRRRSSLESSISQNGTGRYFGVGPLTICVDVGPGMEHASCYGVNLVCPVFWGVVFFPRGGASRPAGPRRSSPESPSSQNGTRRYFGVGPLTICVDAGPEVEHASCCGVNLACPLFGVCWFFPQAAKAVPLHNCAFFRKQRKPCPSELRVFPQAVKAVPLHNCAFFRKL